MMAKPNRGASDGWNAHRSEQRAGELAATPLQRLEWLEEAIAFAFLAGALARRTPAQRTATVNRPRGPEPSVP